MPAFRLPLSGNVTQSINPWTMLFNPVGSQVGLVNIDLGQSSGPAQKFCNSLWSGALAAEPVKRSEARVQGFVLADDHHVRRRVEPDVVGHLAADLGDIACAIRLAVVLHDPVGALVEALRARLVVDFINALGDLLTAADQRRSVLAHVIGFFAVRLRYREYPGAEDRVIGLRRPRRVGAGTVRQDRENEGEQGGSQRVLRDPGTRRVEDTLKI